MANIIFNMALGKIAQWGQNIATNTPANSAFIVDILAATGIETDAVLKDKDDWAAVISGTTNYVTNSGYVRKVITDADAVTYLPDDTGDQVYVDCNDLTWTSVGVGDGWNSLIIGYDSDTTAGTDTNIVPATKHDFVVECGPLAA